MRRRGSGSIIRGYAVAPATMQLGPVLLGEVRQGLEVDALVALAHAVAHEVVPACRLR